MAKSFGYQLKACGRKGMPENIRIGENRYNLYRVIKHDFFAATGEYRHNGEHIAGQVSSPGKIIFKVCRENQFLGIPLSWFGAMLCRHEVFILEYLSDLEGTPKFLSRYSKTAFIYEYIEAKDLSDANEVPENFFEQLFVLLGEVHQRNIVYLDLNKRGNILVGKDGKPYLIDFQISFRIGDFFLGWPRLSKYLRDSLQNADMYHLFKHKRKICPESLTPEEQLISRKTTKLIRLHRLIANPYRAIRRSILRKLHKKGLLVTDESTGHSEDDLERFD